MSLARRFIRRFQRTSIDPFAQLRTTGSSMADAIASLVPPDHVMSVEQIKQAATRFADELVREATPQWRTDGMSDEAINSIGPVIRDKYASAFCERLLLKCASNIDIETKGTS